jgi:hypothetical protein
MDYVPSLPYCGIAFLLVVLGSAFRQVSFGGLAFFLALFVGRMAFLLDLFVGVFLLVA